MLFNYLKIALRGMLRNKSFSIINIAGLSIGLLTFLAITLYVVDELSYDQFHEKKDRIYRAIINADFDGQVQRWGAVPNLVAPTVAKEIPEVEKVTRLFHHNFGDISFITARDEKYTENNLFYADPEIFDVFTLPLVKGDAKQALNRPNTVILSERAAKKYFADADPIGQTITVDNRTTLEVTGVFKNLPGNSFLTFELLASFSSHYFGKPESESWGNASFATYFLLHPGTAQKTAEEKIAGMLERNIEKDGRWYSISLQPLTDIRLFSGDLTTSIDRTQYGNIEHVKILGSLAIIILLIAAINYMNLTTAQSQRRNKEVGISKTLGASQLHLKGKFYFEASLFVLAALLISVSLFSFILPFYNYLTGKDITMEFIGTYSFWIGFTGIWLVLTFLSGFYPAQYLSSFSPKAVLQKAAGSKGASGLRKSLVVLQFTASVVLIISAFVFIKQMKFIQNKNLGYKPEQVVSVMISATRDQSLINSLKTEFESIAEVKSVCKSQSYPGIGTSGYSVKHVGDDGQGASILTTRATAEVLDVLGIKLLAGRTLPETKSPEDTTIQVVINKSTADYLQLSPEEAIGKQIMIFNSRPSEVVGVTEDFHFTSIHQKIGPYCFNNNNDNRYIYLLVKIESQNIAATIEKLESSFKKLIPAAFEYTFLDSQMAKLYDNEQRLSDLIFAAAGIAIFIACLGLYALAAYTAEQRVKEIGIRKVLGASVNGLVLLLSKDFMKLIGIALLLGLPIGYYFMNQWLQGFAYKTTLDITVFVLTGIVTTTIAWLTVSFESIRTAASNPVNSLRNE